MSSVNSDDEECFRELEKPVVPPFQTDGLDPQEILLREAEEDMMRALASVRLSAAGDEPSVASDDGMGDEEAHLKQAQEETMRDVQGLLLMDINEEMSTPDGIASFPGSSLSNKEKKPASKKEMMQRAEAAAERAKMIVEQGKQWKGEDGHFVDDEEETAPEVHSVLLMDIPQVTSKKATKKKKLGKKESKKMREEEMQRALAAAAVAKHITIMDQEEQWKGKGGMSPLPIMSRGMKV